MYGTLIQQYKMSISKGIPKKIGLYYCYFWVGLEEEDSSSGVRGTATDPRLGRDFANIHFKYKKKKKYSSKAWKDRYYYCCNHKNAQQTE